MCALVCVCTSASMRALFSFNILCICLSAICCLCFLIYTECNLSYVHSIDEKSFDCESAPNALLGSNNIHNCLEIVMSIFFRCNLWWAAISFQHYLVRIWLADISNHLLLLDVSFVIQSLFSCLRPLSLSHNLSHCASPSSILFPLRSLSLLLFRTHIRKRPQCMHKHTTTTTSTTAPRVLAKFQ